MLIVDKAADHAAPPFSLDPAAQSWVEETLAELTLEQRIAQLMCLYLRSSDMAEWTAWLDERGIEPGGFMVLPRSTADAQRDVRTLQQWSRVPLLVAGNLESGAVNFLTDSEAFANPMQLGATGDPAAARALAIHCARLAGHVGINWSFAPVVDLAVNPDNPITNTRTFGSDVETVASLSEAYIHELESRGIATTTKHFPGDGVDGRDQHLATTSNDLPLDEWWRTYGHVYERAIAAGTRTVMVGHIRHPALSRAARPTLENRDLMPATLAPELIRVLRDDLEFTGLIVSDNSAMTGFTSQAPRREGLTGMFNAGVDMLLGNLDAEEDFQMILEAARAGEISPLRIEESVRRVLALKASLGLHGSPAALEIEPPDRFEESAWRDSIARRSVTLVKDTQQLLPLDPQRHRRALVYVLGDTPTFYDPTRPLAPQFVAGLEARGLEVEVRQIPGNATTPAEAEHLHETFDVCIYFADVRFTGNSNTNRLAWSPAQGWDAPRHVATLPTALVSVADPYLLRDVPMIRTAINGYTPTGSVVEACLAVLFGEAEAAGVSPIDPFAGHWDAAL